MVNWKKLAKDVGSKAKDAAVYTGEKAKEASVSVGKSAGIGLSDEEKEEKHKQTVTNLKRKAELEEAKLSRQTTNNELRARTAVAKKTFNENKPESGFGRFKKTLDGMKEQAQIQQERAKAKQALNPVVKKKQLIQPKQQRMSSGGMNFEQMLGMDGSSGGSFDDMIGGIKKKGKKVKQKQGPSFDDMLGIGTKKKGKKKKGKQKSWDDMMGGGF